MNNLDNNTDKKSIAYKSGYLLGAVLVGCVAALAVALTIKVVLLLF